MNAESLLVIPTSQDVKSILNSGKQVDTVAEVEESLDWYFPEIDAGRRPFGARVLLQLRRQRKVSKGGIMLPAEIQEIDKWNDQIAKVIKLGALAFRNRETQEPWPEGAWAAPGDYVSIPRWGGDRWSKKVKDSDDEVTFVIFNDIDLISAITEDPRNVKAFIL